MKIKVLIIEDDPGIVESISLAFRLRLELSPLTWGEKG